MSLSPQSGDQIAAVPKNDRFHFFPFVSVLDFHLHSAIPRD